MKTKLKNCLERLGEIRNKYSFLFVAFIVPLIMLWMIFIVLEMYPFGKESVLILDLNGQYVNFFADLKYKLSEGGSFLYSWTRSMGGEYMGIFAYYLASPFSFLVGLFPHSHLTEAIMLMILLKTGAMGATMSYYLNETYKTKPINTLIFSTCYALSSYTISMGHNTMWFDCLIFLPLVTLGIERIIKKGHFKLFVVSLAMCLLTSFYIGYMVCIYVAIYFFYYYLASGARFQNNFYLEDNHFFKSLGRIILYSGIAIAIAAIIILPARTSLQFGKDTFSEPQMAWTQRFDWLDLLAKFLPGSYDTVRPEGFPFVYCGVIVLILVPMYFMTSRISWQERLMGGVVISVFLLSFNLDVLDTIWHGFQKPNWLNYRYSFMLIFLLLVFAYKAFVNLKYANYKNIVLTCGFLVLMVVFIQKQDYENIDDFKSIMFSLFSIGIFCASLYFIYRNKNKRTMTAIVMLLVCGELFYAGLINAVSLDEDVVISSRDSYSDYYSAIRPTVEAVKDYDDSPFYRMEKTFHRQNDSRTNDAMSLNMYGISNSTSTLNKSVINLLHRYGYVSKSHLSQYLGGTPVSDALIGIKYVISNKEIINGVHKEVLQKTVDTELEKGLQALNTGIFKVTNTEYILRAYENPYALSLAFGASSAVKGFQITDYESPFKAMNATVSAIVGAKEELQIFNKLTVVDTLFTSVKTDFVTNHRKYSAENNTSGRIKFIVNVNAGEPVYMYVPTDYPRECSLSVNGRSMGKLMGNKTDCVVYLGIFEEAQPLSVELIIDKETPIYIRNNEDFFFSLDNELFASTFTEIAKGNMEITKFEQDYFEGNVTIQPGQSLLYTTVSFDEGWIVTVDGKKADLIKINDSQIAVKITEGEHKITFKYRPKCYVHGSALSVCGILAFGGAITFEEMKKRRDNKKWAEVSKVS